MRSPEEVFLLVAMASLRRRYDTSRVLFEAQDPAFDGAGLQHVPGVSAVAAEGSGFELRLKQGTDPAVVMREVVTLAAPARIEVARLTLEDMFVGIVRAEAGDSEQALREHLQGLSGAVESALDVVS